MVAGVATPDVSASAMMLTMLETPNLIHQHADRLLAANRHLRHAIAVDRRNVVEPTDSDPVDQSQGTTRIASCCIRSIRGRIMQENLHA